MGQILKVVTGLGVLFYLGRQAANTISSQVRYTFDALRRTDISFRLERGVFVGRLRVRMFITQETGATISARALRLELSQQGQSIGQVRVNTSVVLPSGVETPVEFDFIIPATEFLDRLQRILDSPDGQWYAPIQMKGWVTLSNGWELPIRHTYKLFS